MINNKIKPSQGSRILGEITFQSTIAMMSEFIRSAIRVVGIILYKKLVISDSKDFMLI